MSVIYKPAGRALEYVPDGYALNIYKGCTHQCIYCYNSVGRFNKDYFKESNPKKDILPALEKQLKTNKFKNQKIFISFLSDAYQPDERTLRLMPDVFYLLWKYNTIPVLLTKGEIPEEDWGIFIKFREFHFGTTLVMLDDLKAATKEKNAPPPSLRIKQLIRAKSLGLLTWVSLEPIYHISDAMELIINTHEFVDHYKIGALNYFKSATTDNDWRYFVSWLKDYSAKFNVDYYLKESLQRFDK